MWNLPLQPLKHHISYGTKLDMSTIYHKVLPPTKSCGPVKSRKNLHILYFYYYSDNDCQTWRNV